MWWRREAIAVYDFPRAGGGQVVPGWGKDIYVMALSTSGTHSGTYDPGNDGATGKDWDHALLTMAEALDRAETGDRIWFVGDIREEIDITTITDLNLKFDITITGCGSKHHPDQPGSGSALYHTGGSMWRPPASPTTAAELLHVYGRGWTFRNITFDCPVDAAAVTLNRNASSGTSEYDASHATFDNCRFLSGKYGIEDAGGCYNVTVRNCEFLGMSTTAIVNTSTSVANPLNWKILDSQFPSYVSIGNATHIDSPLNEAVIKGNVFGTVTSTALYIDLTGGNGNVVAGNVLGGVYNNDDYVAGTGDLWLGNWVTVISTQAPNGFTILAPAAA